ncbi:MAG TPA: hypothetical protein VGX28_13190 [Frankiaceae bacterium]|jgi:hypothetical protein|nr:hypothetical protein [Frankiaceae bacterium]
MSLDAIDDVNALMRAQSAALHHRQARALGLSERDVASRLRSGAWVEWHPRVYVAAGAPHTYLTRCHAAVLAIRHGGRWTERRPVAVARLGAAWLHDLDVPEPARVDLVVPLDDAEPALPAVNVVRAATWPRRAFTVVDGLPVTSLQDTLVDIGRLVRRDHLHALVQQAAFGRPGLPLAVLRACRRGRPGSANARRVAALVMAGVDSSLHSRGLALLRAAGLPAVECGVEVVRGAGPSDCVVRSGSQQPPYGLVVEWDGDAHRVDRATFLHDREKDRLVRRAGYVTLRYTSAQVRRRDLVVTDLRAEWAALTARSLQPVRRLPA